MIVLTKRIDIQDLLESEKECEEKRQKMQIFKCQIKQNNIHV